MKKFFPTFERFINENSNNSKKRTVIGGLPCNHAFNDYGIVNGVIDMLEESEKDSGYEISDNVNYKEIFDTIGKYMATDYVPKLIKDELGIDVKFKFKKIQNDGYGIGHCVVDITYNLEDILNLIEENKDLLKKSIKKDHSSKDGYISHISNDINKWVEILNEGGDKREGNMVEYILDTLLEDANAYSDESLINHLYEKFSGQFDFIGESVKVNESKEESKSDCKFIYNEDWLKSLNKLGKASLLDCKKVKQLVGGATHMFVTYEIKANDKSFILSGLTINGLMVNASLQINNAIHTTLDFTYNAKNDKVEDNIKAVIADIRKHIRKNSK